MRRSARLARKEPNSENDAQSEPKAKKNRSNDNIPNITALDNGTMVEMFKYLNYCQLATSSLVSNRFWNLTRTHRHKLALLDVDNIYINSYVAYQDSAVIRCPIIKIFNKELSPKEYNEWIVCNGYSKQVPLDRQVDGMESTENDRVIYEFGANIYQNPNNCYDIAKTVFYAHTKLKDETWPLLHHFIRLIMDPFINIRSLSLHPQKDVSSFLARAMNLDRNRLECKQLSIRFNGGTQKLIVWIKNHVRCDEFEFEIDIDDDSNYNEELFDLFLTGAPCTLAINIKYYGISKVITNFVQKFIGLKNRDECQIVESIRIKVKDRGVIETLKRYYAECIAEQEEYEDDLGTRQVIVFVNNDIEKKLTLNVRKSYYDCPSFSINITDF